MCEKQSKTSEKRQVVFIMTDSTRYDMVSCYREGIQTPWIDKLASEGIRFNKAYTTQPVCGPARSALFTGQFSHSNGSWGNSMPLGDNIKTIGQRLRDHKIHTAYIGKWHLDGGDYFGLGRCPDGWDENYWYDMRNYLYELSPEERYKSRQPETALKDGGIEASFTYGHRCSNRAIDFLEKFNSEDFFLVVSYDEPHGPFLCPEPYASMYKDYEFPVSPNVYDSLDNKPELQKIWSGKTLEQERKNVVIKNQLYFGCQSFIDSEIGRVLQAVEKNCPGAMVVYTSDHGDALMSHRIYAKGPCVYDEIAKVPLIIKGGSLAKTPANVVNDTPISHINLAPTIMEYMSLPVPKLMEGKSVLEALQTNGRMDDYAFLEFSRYEIDHDGFGGFQPMRAVTDGAYKLSIYLLDQTDEFYDTQEDPDELHNLINDERYTEVKEKLHDLILENMNKTRDPFRGYQWAIRPWRSPERSKKASWDNDLYTRQRENEEYEPRQLDYGTGLEMKAAVRIKGTI